MTPKISIIVPCYNAGRHLDACLDSLCAQTLFAQIEVILVDDGSTDDTAEVLARRAASNPALRVVRQENAGAAAARNRGIDEARGEFLMFVDADDLPKPELAQRLLEQMDAETDVACCCCTAFTEETGYHCEQHFFDGSCAMADMREKEKLFLQLMNLHYGQPGARRFTAIGVPWGKLYRASLIRENGLRFPAQLTRLEDNLFNMHAFTLARGVFYLDEPLYRYRIDHIVTAPAAPEMRVAILAERDRWFARYGDRATPAMHRARDAERMRYFITGMRDIARNLPFRQAKAEMRRHCAQPAYEPLLRQPADKLPRKRKLTLALARRGLYGLLILSFRMTAHRAARPDAALIAPQDGARSA